MSQDNLEYLHKIFTVSYNARHHYDGRGQNSVDRFVACGIEKVNKVALGLLQLYPKIDTLPDLEFSIGILLRSILMDDLLVLAIINEVHVLSKGGKNIEEIKSAIKDRCLQYISDGTTLIIDQILTSPDMDEVTKKDLAGKYALTFVRAVEYNEATGNVKSTFAKVNLKGIYMGLKDSDIARKDEVYKQYAFYSKYDHLSHWTGKSGDIPIDNRIHKINFCIMMCMMHLRDLLAIAIDMGDYNDALVSLVTEFNQYMVDTPKNEA